MHKQYDDMTGEIIFIKVYQSRYAIPDFRRSKGKHRQPDDRHPEPTRIDIRIHDSFLLSGCYSFSELLRLLNGNAVEHLFSQQLFEVSFEIVAYASPQSVRY